MFGRLLLGCTLCLLASAAGANSRDYKWLINNLEVYGISPSSIQWSQVESLCMPYRTAAAAQYQACKLEKALLQADYEADSSSCDDTARAFNPAHLRYKAVVLETTLPPAPVASSVTLLNTTPAVADEGAFSRHLFDQCMADKGWRNPRDYRRGRQFAQLP